MANVKLALAPVPGVPLWLQEADDPIAAINTALNTKLHRERWKYTSTKPVLALLPELAVPPEWGTLSDGVTLKICNPGESEAPLAFDISAAPEACSALCYQQQICVLQVRGDIQQPLIITHKSHSSPVIIKLAANARLDLRERYSEDHAQHQTLWIELGPGSQLIHSRNCFSTGTHWQFVRVTIDRDASYTLHNHSGGAQLRRQDVQIICAEAGARATIASAAFVTAGSHLDQQVTIEHRAPNSTSTQVFHNIAGDQAKVTFNGRIHIHHGANGADAQLTNKNLGIGKNAVINTKPELEIYTDDVKCSHGATVGQLDADHLFYCASRGIDPVGARSVLSQAFLNTATQGPSADEARQIFQDLARGV